MCSLPRGRSRSHGVGTRPRSTRQRRHTPNTGDRRGRTVRTEGAGAGRGVGRPALHRGTTGIRGETPHPGGEGGRRPAGAKTPRGRGVAPGSWCLGEIWNLSLRKYMARHIVPETRLCNLKPYKHVSIIELDERVEM